MNSNKRINKLLANPLLLIIDMQNVYRCGQKWECKNYERASDHIKKLLTEFDESDGNALFTKYIASETPKGVWMDYNLENREVNEEAWLNEIDSKFSVYANKFGAANKEVYSCLGSDIVRDKVSSSSCVIVTGVVAECCVLSTVFDLIDQGKYVIYISDAIAGIDEETEAAVQKILAGLAPLHLSLMTTDQYMRCVHVAKGVKINYEQT